LTQNDSNIHVFSVRQHVYFCDKQEENVVVAFSTYLQCRQSYKYFRFWRPYCYFRLSVVVAIIWEHSLSSLWPESYTLWVQLYNNTYSGWWWWRRCGWWRWWWWGDL